MTDHTHECCDAHDHEHDHAYLHAHGIPHSHSHVHENQKAVLNRLSRAIGHLEKVKRMVEEVTTARRFSSNWRRYVPPWTTPAR